MAAPTTDIDVWARNLATFSRQLNQQLNFEIDRSKGRVTGALVRASARAAGSDRRLSRAFGPAGFEAREGSFLGFTIRPLNGGMGYDFQKTGPWQFVDSTVNAGPTKPHTIAPRPDANPRPLRPGRLYRPTMREVGGGWIGRSAVIHGGSERQRHWGAAISRVQPQLDKAFRQIFGNAPKKAF